MELWDAYDRDGIRVGFDLVRGEPIPRGLYHLVCDILVRHADGSYLLMQRDPGKPIFGGWWEATSGGSVLKGEDPVTCAARELREETGLEGRLLPIGIDISQDTIYHQFLCLTAGEKDRIRLQEGETVAWKWVSPEEFRAFVNSEAMIPLQRQRYAPFLTELGFLK